MSGQLNNPDVPSATTNRSGMDKSHELLGQAVGVEERIAARTRGIKAFEEEQKRKARELAATDQEAS